MTEVMCPELSIANGAVDRSDGNRVNSEATFTCDEGFTSGGVASRTCQENGEWSGESPFCSGNAHNDTHITLPISC